MKSVTSSKLDRNSCKFRVNTGGTSTPPGTVPLPTNEIPRDPSHCALPWSTEKVAWRKSVKPSQLRRKTANFASFWPKVHTISVELQKWVEGEYGGSWRIDSKDLKTQDFVVQGIAGRTLVMNAPLTVADPPEIYDSEINSHQFPKYCLNEPDADREQFRKKRLRFAERVLAEGTEVTVFGKGHWEQAADRWKSKQLVMEWTRLFIGKAD